MVKPSEFERLGNKRSLEFQYSGKLKDNILFSSFTVIIFEFS